MTQDRPDAAELLEAVAEYLLAELRLEVPSQQRFRLLVAANLCAIVARELRAGDAPAREDLALLQELLGGDPGEVPAAHEIDAAVREAEAELARRLRSGELDDRLDELAERLSEHVRRKLQVARPDY
ncbi:MAG: hypothetical protein K0S15_36 [Solirubrobacterales bacterium]|nr:hypothetical protein [Solirubrobacterales bacterium]